MLFSTYLGGNFSDSGTGIAVDGAGSIYVVGETNSKNFPTVNAIQAAPLATENCTSGFVSKINPAVPSFVFSTYLGGSNCDDIFAVALDSTADIYLTGRTTSTDFPLANAFQSTIGDTSTFSGDAFVTKLTTSGSLVYSTYLGGSQPDSGRGIGVSTSGEAVVTGNTNSGNFPTLNSLQPFKGVGDQDVFVTKLNTQGSGLVYSTYLGGQNSDSARGVAVDAAGNAHVVGLTFARNFPVVPGASHTRSTLFKTIDNGATWSNDNYGLDYSTNSSITSIVVHPTQTSTIYAATLSGIFKTTNGGRTWSAINNGLTETRVIALLIDPSNPSILYAASSDFSLDSGVYKTTDGGATWNLRKNGISAFDKPVSLAIDPVAPNTLYVGATNVAGGTEGKVFKTIDGADNWLQTGAVPPPSLTSIAVDPLNHTTIYGVSPVGTGTFFRSADSGATWNPVAAGQIPGFGTFVAAVRTRQVCSSLTSPPRGFGRAQTAATTGRK